MKHSAAILFMLMLSQTGCASQLNEARLNLEKWGFAYCLNTYGKDESMKSQSGLSMSGYFEFGSHNEQAAYDNVKIYVKSHYMELAKTSKQSNGEMYLTACLDLYSSSGYSKLVKAQDKFVSNIK